VHSGLFVLVDVNTETIDTMNRVDIRRNKWGPTFLILFFVPGSVYGMYILFLTDMFEGKSVPKVLVPIILAYCLYYAFKEFLDLIKKKVLLGITTSGLEIFDDTLKVFNWDDIKSVELVKKNTQFRVNYLLKVTGNKYSASILLNGLNIGHRKVFELLNEYSSGTAANSMFALWPCDK
jgi:hypothetical protein